MRRREVLPRAAACLGLEVIVLSEISQSQKHRDCMISYRRDSFGDGHGTQFWQMRCRRDPLGNF